MKQLLPSNKNYRNGTIDLQIRFITIFKDAPEKRFHFPAANFPNDYHWSCRVWNLIKNSWFFTGHFFQNQTANCLLISKFLYLFLHLQIKESDQFFLSVQYI